MQAERLASHRRAPRPIGVVAFAVALAVTSLSASVAGAGRGAGRATGAGAGGLRSTAVSREHHDGIQLADLDALYE